MRGTADPGGGGCAESATGRLVTWINFADIAEGRLTGMNRRNETRKNQLAAAGKGLHPRRLARSVARTMGAGKEWREKVAELPAEGRKYLHPERHRA